MENYAKSGIRTVKGFKTNDVLFQKINEVGETYEGGTEQLIRDILAEKLFNSNEINYGQLMDLQDWVLADRNNSITALVDTNTALFYADFEQNKGFARGFVAGEILERFANQRETPVLKEPVKKLAPNEPEKSRIVVINLDEITIDSVRESLEAHGFNELNYLTKETEDETARQFKEILDEQTETLKDKIKKLEFVNDRLNAQLGNNSQNAEMVQDFENILNFAKELVKAHKERNGVFGMFTKISEKDINEICPQKFRHHFV